MWRNPRGKPPNSFWAGFDFDIKLTSNGKITFCGGDLIELFGDICIDSKIKQGYFHFIYFNVNSSTEFIDFTHQLLEGASKYLDGEVVLVMEEKPTVSNKAMVLDIPHLDSLSFLLACSLPAPLLREAQPDSICEICGYKAVTPSVCLRPHPKPPTEAGIQL